MLSPKQIFLDSLDLPADQRRSFIEKQCSGDAQLISRVLALLSAHQAAGGVFDQSPAITTDPGNDESNGKTSGEQPGDSIDRYRLISKLGEGGFGVVYLAEQSEPVSRQVALKVIRAGMDSAQIVARFENERQALAMMDHPGIATVLDAGATASGRPYFVMEYVEGFPITDYCNQNKLNLRQRLELMERVCLAVQHAHQKGIIHRDIKPGNILVANVDGEALPKVIDFGVAKAADPSESFSPLITHEMQIIGTPQYMSPEQATTGVKNIDTRTDVYSLGTVLYELITGLPPFDPTDLRHAAIEQICKVVREQVPAKPSTRISTSLIRTASETASQMRELRSEIDWIVMKSLEKEPSRRYQSPAELAADIDRYLANEPVVARPPSAVYQFKKFAARHQLEIAAAAIVVVALIATAIISIVMASRAIHAEAISRNAESIARNSERLARDSEEKAKIKAEEATAQLQRANAIGDFTDRLLTGISPSVARGADTKLLRELLDVALEANKRDNADQPIVDLTVRSMAAKAFYDLGEYDKAVELLQSSFDACRNTIFKHDRKRLEAGVSLALFLTDKSRTTEALKVIDEVIEGYRAIGDTTSDLSLNARSTRATVLSRSSKPEEAAAIFESLRNELIESGKPTSALALDVTNSLASIYADSGKLAESARLWEEILPVYRKTDGEDGPGTLATMNNLSGVYQSLKEFDKALALSTEELATERKIYEPDHPMLVKTLANYGNLLMTMNKLDEAQPILEEAYKASKEKSARSHRFAIAALHQLLNLRSKQGQFDECVKLSFEMREIYLKDFGEDDPHTRAAFQFIVSSLSDAGKPHEAIKYLEDAGGVDAICAKMTDPVQICSLRANLGIALLKADRRDDAMKQATLARSVLKPDATGRIPGTRRLLLLEQSLGLSTTAPSSQPSTQASTRASTQASTQPK